MLLLTESDVRRLLPMAEAVGLVRKAFMDLAGGEAINHPRHRLILLTGSVLHYMAGGDGKYFGAKIYSTHPAHGAHFLFLLYRASDAQPLALIEANALGQIRTGAASGVATGAMALPGADTVGMIGTGFQARMQLEAMLAVRPVRRTRVWSRSAERRAAFAAECTRELGIEVQAAETAEQAVREASIVITATNAREPVLRSEWIAPGTHINAMGSNQAGRRELPADLVRRADWIAVDSMEQARLEAGDLLLALEEADWNASRLLELRDVVAGRASARRNPREITLFKSIGLAVEDVASAGFVYERALASGAGGEFTQPHS